ncbi:hypothetical protein [Streptomyces sp. NPDC007346]|uniref:hypothetical protein n=1 Tax=Streptomyces sp. NPDC007346 TaxID=3154682 RepID=UPI0034550C25
MAHAEEAAIDVIADLLHRLRAHGCDPDSALDRAQTHFEAELPEAVYPKPYDRGLRNSELR